MKNLSKAVAVISAVCSMALMSTPVSANLLVNGGFEASSSSTATPTGWTNIGHSDGVITYSNFGTPVYEGLNFYDLGGFGNPNGPIGDGISQTVNTIAGTAYTLTFGLSGENTAGVVTVLRVMIDSLFEDFTIVADSSGVFKLPFSTQTFGSYVATGPTTTISFIALSSTRPGFNDALIDNVVFDVANGNSVPEPSAIALLGIGLLGLMGLRRRRF